MRRILLWIKAFWRWMAEAYLFWLTVAVIAAALLFALLKGADEATIRIAGLVLQLLGIGTVAWGIHATRKLFGRPSIFAQTFRWFNRFPRLSGRTINLTARISSTSSIGDVRGYCWMNPGPEASLEERIKALEDNLLDVNQRLCGTQEEIGQRFQGQAADLRDEQDTRTKADQEIREKLVATETGGLHISVMGLLWLSVGLIMSTVATELSKLIR